MSDVSTHDINLSVIVITRNEEKNIEACLQSVAWAKEIIVVDSQSTDRTVELAKKFTKKVFVKEWLGYAGAKNYALDNATSEWILWLDADERVTSELASEIKTIVHNVTNKFTGFEVARRAYFLGKWIKHCGWYPGYVVRLFKREKVRFDDSQVHEKVNIGGATGRLKHDLLHYTDDTLYHYMEKFNRYTTLATRDMKKSGKIFSLYDIIVRPPYLFFKMFILRRGFLDGMHGFILSIMSANYVFVKYAKLREAENHIGLKK
ncbi:MAG: glycosyltransferase family 2 protein [Ignavibacteriales bacterium]|nr:glycosyltransferase family 2 protein [Ignavibacteriales bacterium]